MLMQLINPHLSHSLIISSSNINHSSLSLIFSGNQNEIPLLKLMVSDFLIQGQVGGVQFDGVALLVEVQVN